MAGLPASLMIAIWLVASLWLVGAAAYYFGYDGQWREGEWLWAGANCLLSFALCLLAVWLGYMAVVAVIR